MTPTDRSSIRIRLHGGGYASGEIPLAHLARIAREAQLVTTRLARSQTGRSGPGRTQKPVADEVQLMFVGIEPGSTELVIAEPQSDPTLPLGEDFVPLVDRTLDQFAAGIDASSHGDDLPDGFDALSRRALIDFLLSLEESAAEVEVETQVSDRPPRRVRFRPADARAHLGDDSGTDELTLSGVQIEGVLYLVNLRTNHYRIEDDIGSLIHVQVDAAVNDDIGPLVGQRVRVMGIATLYEDGRIREVQATSVASAEATAGIDSSLYWSQQATVDRVATARPLDSPEDLIIEGIGEEEINELLRAIKG